MTSKTTNVLFLCTGNSARSILAEALLTHLGKDRVRGYSAGSFPKGKVHPLSIELLTARGIPTAGLHSKSWDTFSAAGAPVMDYVFTVCDQAAGEVCPIWPGHPITAHWGLPDPAAVEGPREEQMQAFQTAFLTIESRIRYFLSYGLDELRREERQKKAYEAGIITVKAP